MKNIIFLGTFLIFHFTFSQNQVVVSLFSEYEGQNVIISSDTIPAQIYYNLTGHESVGDIVLNVIFLFDDGTESRSELEVLSYKRNEVDHSVDMLIKREDGEVRYLFYYNDHLIISQSKSGNFIWSGDIVF